MDVFAEIGEQVPEFFGGQVDEIALSDLRLGLLSDEVLALNVVILAEKLQKFESSPVSSDALIAVEFFTGRVGLENVLSGTVLRSFIVVIIIIDSRDWKVSLFYFHSSASFTDVLSDQTSEFGNQGVKVGHHFVFLVAA